MGAALIGGVMLLGGVLATVGAQARPLGPRDLATEGLSYESELTALYLGDFENARLASDGLRFAVVFHEYLDGYAVHCADFLPANRVEITEEKCAREQTPVNAFGTPVGTTSCIQYVRVGTGRYADPLLWRIALDLESKVTVSTMRGAFGLDGGNAVETTRQLADIAVSLGDDMDALFQRNACDQPSLERLQANMVRFAQGQSPLRLPGGETLADLRAESREGAFQDSDYARLIDDLVGENSRGWAMNRYLTGSARNASVRERDAVGRPVTIDADYDYAAFQTRYQGKVTLTFEGGLPECLYFSDAPSVCRLPSRRVTTAYEKGAYR